MHDISNDDKLLGFKDSRRFLLLRVVGTLRNEFISAVCENTGTSFKNSLIFKSSEDETDDESLPDELNRLGLELV